MKICILYCPPPPCHMTPVNKTTQRIVDPDRMKGRGSPYSETVTQRLEVGEREEGRMTLNTQKLHPKPRRTAHAMTDGEFSRQLP